MDGEGQEGRPASVVSGEWNGGLQGSVHKGGMQAVFGKFRRNGLGQLQSAERFVGAQSYFLHGTEPGSVGHAVGCKQLLTFFFV